MTDALWFLFSPPAIALLALAGAVWVFRRPGSRAAPRFLLVVSVSYTALSIYGISYQFERALAWGYQPLTAADVPQGRIAVVILGSGSFTTRNWDQEEYVVVDFDAAERVLEAARLYRMLGPAWIISSGGKAHANDPARPTAVAMEKALEALGIPPQRILTETQSRNTFEEAELLGPVLKELGAEHVVLVTSARHMRRALGAFRAAGVTVIPAIARNSYVDRPWADWWVPSSKGLSEASLVAHEFGGIAAYLATGRYRF